IPYVFVSFAIFFFSSRRRHTRSKRDWSSDVCSSDLFSFLINHVQVVLFHVPSLFSLCNHSHLYIHLFQQFYVQFHVPTAFVLIAELLFLANLQMVEFYSMSNLVE